MQIDYIFFDGHRVASIDSSGNVHYLFSDVLGSTRVATDSSGNVCFDADYYPYGQENDYSTSCDPEYKFAGMEYDSETGNYYDYARYYNPRLGRFMTPDPSNAGAVAGNPQSWNAYSYVVNNPETFIDPFGRQTQTCASVVQGWTSSGEEDGPSLQPMPSGRMPDFGCAADVSITGSHEIPNPIQNPTVPVRVGKPNPDRPPQSQAPKQPQKKPCTPLADNLQGTPAAGFDTFLDAFHRLTSPIEMVAENGFIFVGGVGAVAGGYAAIAAGCADPSPFEPATCGAGILGGVPTIAGGGVLIKGGVSFFKSYTVPAIKDWICHE